MTIAGMYNVLAFDVKWIMTDKGTLTIWVNDQMIAKEVIRMMEVIEDVLFDYDGAYYSTCDGVNGTITYTMIPLAVAQNLIKELEKNFTLCPVETEYELYAQEVVGSATGNDAGRCL